MANILLAVCLTRLHNPGKSNNAIIAGALGAGEIPVRSLSARELVALES